jgi:DNA invertase Pin-like site-specific DNA recombinase
MGEFVAYYRVSTERQRVSGLGLEAQREAGAIRPFIAKTAMNGAQLVMVHGDSSGMMSGPPALSIIGKPRSSFSIFESRVP